MIGFSLEEAEAIKQFALNENPMSSAIRKYLKYKIERCNRLCDANLRNSMQTDSASSMKEARDYAAKSQAYASFFPELQREIESLSEPTGQGED